MGTVISTKLDGSVDSALGLDALALRPKTRRMESFATAYIYPTCPTHDEYRRQTAAPPVVRSSASRATARGPSASFIKHTVLQRV
jgi:hypothetical protein